MKSEFINNKLKSMNNSMNNRFIVSLILISLLMLFSYSFATSTYLDLNKYKKYNESNLNFTNKTLIVNGTTYMLFYLNNIPIFLVKDNQIINNKSKIENVIYNYYKQKYNVDDAKLREILDLIYAYNYTRSDYKYGYSEINCLKNLFIDGSRAYGSERVYCRPEPGKTPQQDGGCLMAYKLKNYQLSNIGVSIPYTVTQYINYIYNLRKTTDEESDILDKAYNDISNSLESNDLDDLYSSIHYLSGKMSHLKSLQRNYQMSPLTGWSWGYGDANKDSEKASYCGNSQNTCFKLCNYILYNDTAYNQLNDLVKNADTNLGHFIEYKQIYPQVYNNTIDRLNYYNESLLADKYFSSIKNIISHLNKTEMNAQFSLALISDPLLENRLDEINNQFASINSSLKQHNFTNISDKINNLKYLLTSADKIIQKDISNYDNITNQTIKIDAYLYILNSEQLSSDESKQVQNISSEYYNLILNRPYTSSSVQTMVSKFPDLLNKLKDIKKEHDTSFGVILNHKIRFFARELNKGIISFGNSFGIDISSINSKNNTTIFAGFSALLFLSLFSLMLLLFMHFLAGMWVKHKVTYVKVMMLSLIFMILSIMILLASISLYSELVNTTKSVLFSEFISDLYSTHSVNLLINASGVKGTTVWYDDVLKCSNEFVQNFNQKSVHVYAISPDNVCYEYQYNFTYQSLSKSNEVGNSSKNITDESANVSTETQNRNTAIIVKVSKNPSNQCSKLRGNKNSLLIQVVPSIVPGTKIEPNTLFDNLITIKTDKFDASVCKFEKIISYAYEIH